MTSQFIRHGRTRDADPRSVPLPVPNEKDLVLVDTTWGTIQPLQPCPDVQTVEQARLSFGTYDPVRSACGSVY